MLRLLKNKMNDNVGYDVDSTEPNVIRGTHSHVGPIVSYSSTGPISKRLHGFAQQITPQGSESGSVSSSACEKDSDNCSQHGRSPSNADDSTTANHPVNSRVFAGDSPTVEKIRLVKRLGNDVLNQTQGAMVSLPPITPRSCAVKTEDQKLVRTKARKISMDGEASPRQKRPRVESDIESRRASSISEAATVRPIAPSPSTRILLSSQQDESVLSPLHVFVRKQVEVFTATVAELGQPAPGRKQPIQLHQVGLRCIHCMHLPSRKRVKRAVCYPSSVGRVYHSVSDMKFDHFPLCKGLPDDVRKTFESLRAEGNRSGEKKPTIRKSGYSSSTAQYYHDSALQMGMMDCSGGIYMSSPDSGMPYAPQLSSAASSSQSNSSNTKIPGAAQLCIPLHYQVAASRLTLQQQYDLAVMNAAVLMNRHSASFPSMLLALRNSGIAPTEADLTHLTTTPTTITKAANIETVEPAEQSEGEVNCDIEEKVEKTFKDIGSTSQDHCTDVRVIADNGTVCLSDADDDQFLNPLHCFVRKNVELFSANEDDISAPAPGRKTRVVLGQVGVRCIHCAKLPLKERVKRAVCYPPSVTGLYHSISNMKFDHFGICRGLPSEHREEFTNLKKSCSRRSTIGTKCASSASSTAQYYHDSAVRKGLEDTYEGIRFKGRKNLDGTISKVPKPQLHTGISALMMAASQAA